MSKTGASYIARTAAVNPRQATEILIEAMEHDGFAHIDYLTQCPTWNKDAKQYVPYIDVQDSEDYEFDVHDRDEAAHMMRQTDKRLHQGEILTGRYYVEEGRPSYLEEKRRTGQMSEEPTVERYFDDDADWKASADLLDRHR